MLRLPFPARQDLTRRESLTVIVSLAYFMRMHISPASGWRYRIAGLQMRVDYNISYSLRNTRYANGSRRHLSVGRDDALGVYDGAAAFYAARRLIAFDEIASSVRMIGRLMAPGSSLVTAQGAYQARGLPLRAVASRYRFSGRSNRTSTLRRFMLGAGA